MATFGESYAFGMEMPGRKWQASNYRYSHNGQEKEDEVFSGAQSAEYWMYDSRLGRRWNIDPIVDENLSPYACFANNPIYFNDVKGLTPTDPKKKGGSDLKKDNEWKFKQPQNNNPKSVPIEFDETKATIYLGRIETKLPQDNTMVKEPTGLILDKKPETVEKTPLPVYTDIDVWFTNASTKPLAASNSNTQDRSNTFNSREPDARKLVNLPQSGLTSIGVGVGVIGISFNLQDSKLEGSVSKSFMRGTMGASAGTGGFGLNAIYNSPSYKPKSNASLDLGFYSSGRTVESFQYMVSFTSANHRKYIDMGNCSFYASYKVVSITNIYSQITFIGNETMNIKQFRNESYPETSSSLLPGGISTGWFQTMDTVIKSQNVGGSYGKLGATWKF